jgi:predicted transcriptional regulator of viral defense system
MRNNTESKKVIELISGLPYFKTTDLFSVIKNKAYLKIIVSRYFKKGLIVRLKKGFYVAREYLDFLEKKGAYGNYSEFLANILYKPSYLSLEYVLAEYNIITELPKNITSISLNKTNKFFNVINVFSYCRIKKELFLGFEIIKKNNFVIYRATKAKALFDFFYLRKNLLVDKKAFLETRLNLNNLSSKDLKELKKYIDLEGSEKMKRIFNYFSK